jgi:DNA modification methylase
MRSKSAVLERTNGNRNKLLAADRQAHDWYRFVLSFPPNLVRDYLQRFRVDAEQCVLDPFCGTGTTLVECKRLGIRSVGVEANPMAWLASRVKTDWSANPEGLVRHAEFVADRTLERLRADGVEDDPFFAVPRRPHTSLRALAPEQESLLLTSSISPLPLHKTLTLLETLQESRDERFHDYERLALAKALVQSIGNLHFGPEVGVGPPKPDAPVVSSWLQGVHGIADDLRDFARLNRIPATVHRADARKIADLLEPESIDAVITSPPYPNEKDYTRTTRLESVLLGLICNKEELRNLKKGLVRSNTRSVYVADDDDQWIRDHPEIKRIAEAIEKRRVELGKTSGFERLYPRVTKLYFGGMARHLAGLRQVLRPGAQLAYVVGDQASYLRIMIRTGKILAEIAQSLGYELTGIDLFRTRLATATREQLREEVVLLRWPRTLASSGVKERPAKYRRKPGKKRP